VQLHLNGAGHRAWIPDPQQPLIAVAYAVIIRVDAEAATFARRNAQDEQLGVAGADVGSTSAAR
jgi:hypothetical protein